MAQEVVVEPILSKEMVQAGKKTIEHLDRNDIQIKAALWSYDPEAERWKLLIALPDVDTKGPLWAYKLIRESMEKISESELRIGPEHISVVDAEDTLIASLRGAIKIPGINGTRFIKSVVNGVYLDDVYVCRMT